MAENNEAGEAIGAPAVVYKCSSEFFRVFVGASRESVRAVYLALDEAGSELLKNSCFCYVKRRAHVSDFILPMCVNDLVILVDAFDEVISRKWAITVSRKLARPGLVVRAAFSSPGVAFSSMGGRYYGGDEVLDKEKEWRDIRFRVFQRDEFKCRYCGRSAPSVVLHCDHVVPRSRGGSDCIDNLVTSCEDCNLGKSAIMGVVPPESGGAS